MAMPLTDGEHELLVHGLVDDVAFVWVLILLGLRGNPPEEWAPPSPAEVDAALQVLEKLSCAGLLEVGHMEYIDGGPSGRVAPVRHVEDPMDEVVERVRAACRGGADWEWSCWVVNTLAGDEAAHHVLGQAPGTA